jgi:hypothetical protein
MKKNNKQWRRVVSDTLKKLGMRSEELGIKTLYAGMGSSKKDYSSFLIPHFFCMALLFLLIK